MASWDPTSYVAEALSRRITTAAKHEHSLESLSYYDALARHFHSVNESESIKDALIEQNERNVNINIDTCRTPVYVFFNPRDVQSVHETRDEIKAICYDALKKRNALSDEIKELQMSSGESTVSSDLYQILNTLQGANKLIGNTFDLKVCCQYVQEPNDYGIPSSLSDLQLLDNLRVKWPKGLSLLLEDFFDAWFVDNCVFKMEQCKNLIGAIFTLNGLSHAFGVPRGSEVWKSGISIQCDDGSTRYIGSVDLCDDFPAVATSFSKSSIEDPLGLECGVLACRSAFEAHCLVTALVSFDSCKTSLNAIKEWREVESNDFSMTLLGFQLFCVSGKTISDEDDNEIGEMDSARIQGLDKHSLMNKVHQHIEKHAKFGDFALKDVRRNNSADSFHLLLSHRDRNLETQMQNCFSFLHEKCAVISYVGHSNTVGVGCVYGVQFSQYDSSVCTLTVHRSSPSYNYVFAEGSQCTLNFFGEDAEDEYVSILESYPSWINNPDNGPVFFEHESKRYVTTALLKRKGLQTVFTTLRSSLVGDRLFLIGNLSHIVTGSMLMKSLKTYYPSQYPPYQCIQPFFLTAVHRLYGTMGLVGWGCHICSLEPPMISFHCSAESSDIVLSEDSFGFKCLLTFLTPSGAPIFDNKTCKEIMSFLPISADAVLTLPSTSVAFRLSCRFIEKVQGVLVGEVVCFMSVLEANLVSEGSMALRLFTGGDIVYSL